MNNWLSGVGTDVFVRTMLASAAVLFLPAQASAQEQDVERSQGGAPTVDSQAEARGGLSEIIVTARKREETAQNAPVAITAISAATLSKYAINNLESATAIVPQLVIARGAAGSGAQVSLRGVGSNFSSVGIEQSVAVILDGVYYGQGRIINEGLFDSERVEILKGPQALFFGKNATAGVISVQTADPTSDWTGSVRARYEFNAQEVGLEGVISGPLTDTLGLRVAVRGARMFDGYFRNRGGSDSYDTFDVATNAVDTLVSTPANSVGPEERQILGRVTLKWQPTDRLTAKLKVSGTYDRTNNPGWNVVPICPGANQQIATTSPCERKFTIYQSNIPREIAALGVPYTRNGDLYSRYWSYSVTGSLDYDLPGINLSAVSNYQQYNNQMLADYFYEAPVVGGGGGGGWGPERSKWHAFSTEARALTDMEGAINGMVGVYYQKTKLNNDLLPVFAGLRNSEAPAGFDYVGAWKSSFTDGETMSAFGQIIVTPTANIELTGGVRYIHETKDSIYIQPYANPALVPFIYLVNEPVIGDQTFNNWSPEFTAKWEVMRDFNIYAAYKTGYKSGGFSNNSIYGINTQPGDLDFDGEKAKGFEGGIKTMLLDRQLRLNLTAYRYRYSNLQVDFYNAILISFVTTNAGSAIVKGLELEGEFAPHSVPGLRLNGSINYNRARYRSFLGPCYGGQTTQAGCTLTGPGGAFFQDLSGKPLANAPLWTASGGVDYAMPVGRGMSLRLSLDGRYSSSYHASPFFADLSRQKSYFLLNGSIALAGDQDRWELSLVGRNLTNRFILTGVYDVTGTGSGTGTPAGISSDQAGSIALPRTVQIQATRRF